MKVLFGIVITIILFFIVTQVIDKPVQEVFSPPEEETKTVSKEDRYFAARATAEDILIAWETNNWEVVHSYVLDTPKKEFVFFMEMWSPRVRAEYDPRFVAEGDEGTSMSVRRLLTIDEGADVLVDISHNGAPVNYWNQFSMQWEDGWVMKSPVKNFDPYTACPKEYNSYCLKEFAVTFNNESYCADTGVYALECFQAFDKVPPIDLMLEVCSVNVLKQKYDECLGKAISKDNPELCDNMQLIQNKYFCHGEVAALNEDLSMCLDRIETRGTTKEVHKAQCILAYVSMTGENFCGLIDITESKEECYSILDSFKV